MLWISLSLSSRNLNDVTSVAEIVSILHQEFVLRFAKHVHDDTVVSNERINSFFSRGQVTPVHTCALSVSCGSDVQESSSVSQARGCRTMASTSAEHDSPYPQTHFSPPRRPFRRLQDPREGNDQTPCDDLQAGVCHKSDKISIVRGEKPVQLIQNSIETGEIAKEDHDAPLCASCVQETFKNVQRKLAVSVTIGTQLLSHTLMPLP